MKKKKKRKKLALTGKRGLAEFVYIYFLKYHTIFVLFENTVNNNRRLTLKKEKKEKRKK